MKPWQSLPFPALAETDLVIPRVYCCFLEINTSQEALERLLGLRYRTRPEFLLFC